MHAKRGTRLLIVADVRLYREGLAQLLAREDDVCVVAIAANHADALTQLQSRPADVVLVDMAMAESLNTVAAIAARAPDVKVVALAVPDVGRDVIACAEAGAAAYVPRDGSLRDLLDAVRGIARGEVRCSPRIAGSLIQRLAALAAERPGARATALLTARELQIVRLISEGSSNKDIAMTLGIGLPTVKNHVHHVLEKLGVRRRAEVTASYREAPGHLLPSA
jgi:DNA-binding NarL/FixJ family response regulator